MSLEEVEALDDPFLLEAFVPPKVPWLAWEVYSFLKTNHIHCLMTNGYGIIGIDKDKLERMAERRGIDLVRYDTFVELFIDKAVTWHQETRS